MCILRRNATACIPHANEFRPADHPCRHEGNLIEGWAPEDAACVGVVGMREGCVGDNMRLCAPGGRSSPGLCVRDTGALSLQPHCPKVLQESACHSGI